MKKWLKYLIPGGNLEQEAVKGVNELEKEAEQELPKKVNKEVKRHYLLYILGLLLVLVLAGYFAITYAKDVKETKKNQDLLQQQIDLQKKQLDLQNKQIEDAEKNNTTTLPVTTTQPKTTTPTCDKTKQQDQEKVLNELIYKLEVGIKNNESLVRQYEAKLEQTEEAIYDYDYYRGKINDLNQSITDNTANIRYRKADLEGVNKCVLMTDEVTSIFRKMSGK
jgi:cytoskeletal protein RodZ